MSTIIDKTDGRIQQGYSMSKLMLETLCLET